MADANNDMGAVYDALRCDLIHLLMEHRSQGRFTRAAEGTDQARSLFLFDLTHSVADILVAAYPKKDSKRVRCGPRRRSNHCQLRPRSWPSDEPLTPTVAGTPQRERSKLRRRYFPNLGRDPSRVRS